MPATNPGTTNLVAWWSLDEASGTRNDSHGTNHLTVHGTGGVGSAAGKVGNAADFELLDTDYLDCADSASLSMADIDFTICGWVRLESKVITGLVICKGDATTDPQIEYVLGWNGPADRFRFLVGNNVSSQAVLANTFGAPATATWYFLTAQHDASGNTVGISVNAGVIDTAAWSGGSWNSARSTVVGGALAGATPVVTWDGLIDELCVYKRLLTADEITWLYNGGSGRAYSALAAAKGLPVIAHHHRQIFGG